MPVIKCSNGKYRIGNGPCMYKSKESAIRAYRAYLAKHPDESRRLNAVRKKTKNK